LARMLQTAIGGPAPGARPAIDVGTMPGVSAEVADRLREANLSTPEMILEAGEGELQGVEGVDADLADSIVAWAETLNQEQAERAQADIGKTFRAPEASSSMGDDDFMAALNRAFQESEQQRASVQWPGEEPEAAAEKTPPDEAEEPNTRENE
ncbi:MAG TPA: helix-hairpin-helix domain-containing protein, partial [Thermoanaerobaculia bacterium]|nr:helix-hairpin-helix domain-containing protein [Thermoanaerobaculia bacterium]